VGEVVVLGIQRPLLQLEVILSFLQLQQLVEEGGPVMALLPEVAVQVVVGPMEI
jgi:hypothetical protein